MSDNLRIWSQVEKTDPTHTKGFKRAGGFSGTALKPMWVWKRLTEEFGPMGLGWGCGQPTFEVVQTQTEILVYCTVSAWHGSPENVLWGVGGDKVLTVNKYGPASDDEAFKKAFTDALMNAFKFIGVGADIHMGLFDDNKYVAELKAEFSRPANGPDVHPEGPDWWSCDGPGMTAHAAKKEGLGERFEELRAELSSLTSGAEWRAWCKNNTDAIRPLPKSWRVMLRQEAEDMARELGVDLNNRAAA